MDMVRYYSLIAQRDGYLKQINRLEKQEMAASARIAKLEADIRLQQEHRKNLARTRLQLLNTLQFYQAQVEMADKEVA